MAIDKSKWNLNVKVSQKTIDEIKKMGMTKALKTASGSAAAARNNGDASAKEWNEGLRRLYGADRVGAMGNAAGGAKSANTKAPLRKPAGAYTKGATKSGSTVTTGSKSTSKPTLAKSTLANYNKDTQKLPNNMSTAGKSEPRKGLTPQQVAGWGLSAAALIATRGKVRNAGGVIGALKGAKGALTKSAGSSVNAAKAAAVQAGAKNAAATTAKKTVVKKAAAKPAVKTVTSKSKSGPGIKTSIVKSGPNKGKTAKTTSGKYYSTTTYTKPKGGKK